MICTCFVPGECLLEADTCGWRKSVWRTKKGRCDDIAGRIFLGTVLQPGAYETCVYCTLYLVFWLDLFMQHLWRLVLMNSDVQTCTNILRYIISTFSFFLWFSAFLSIARFVSPCHHSSCFPALSFIMQYNNCFGLPLVRGFHSVSLL